MAEHTSHTVLATKYRPQKLSEVVGQDTLVKTLREGIANDRLPNAFLLHGIRGVGKTTTARILAKALNCVGPDGQGNPTADPCGVCASCVAIQEDRHLDVVEMDAASRTGVDDVREVIDAAKYKAVDGRYRIYVIDEVHMLSKSAFNALLKTLEEPPRHVKFIFATTEIHKIPDTVLSRCMRFDLNRIKPEDLMKHYQSVLDRESVKVDSDALAMVVRAADGSARDGLSLLDQAIALSDGEIQAETVRDMLGVVDRGQLFQLLGSLLKGDVESALAQMRNLYAAGGEATSTLGSLLDIVYWCVCMKSAPQLQHDPTWPEGDRGQAKELSDKVTLPILMQAWQILLKGFEEAKRAPMPRQAAEMVLVRLSYISDLPSLESLIQSGATQQAHPAQVVNMAPPKPASQPIAQPMPQSTVQAEPAKIEAQKKTLDDRGVEPEPQDEACEEGIVSLEDIAQILTDAKEVMLYSHLTKGAHFISIAGTQLTVRLSEDTPKTFVKDLNKVLNQKTGMAWQIDLSDEEGEPTLEQQKLSAERQRLDAIKQQPFVKNMLEVFPETKVKICN